MITTIYVTIKDGCLDGVYSDGEEVLVELVDYDNIRDGSDSSFANELELMIENGEVKSCY